MGSTTGITRKQSQTGGLMKLISQHISDIRPITTATKITLSPMPHSCLRISIIISPVLILSIFNVCDIKKDYSPALIVSVCVLFDHFT